MRLFNFYFLIGSGNPGISIQHAVSCVSGLRQLASQGILFRCALVGEEAFPRDQMKARIRDFLYAQLAQAQQATSFSISEHLFEYIGTQFPPLSAIREDEFDYRFFFFKEIY